MKEKTNAEKKEVQETIGIINNLNEKIKLTTKLRNESNDISQINQYNRELSKQESELKKTYRHTTKKQCFIKRTKCTNSGINSQYRAIKFNVQEFGSYHDWTFCG